MAKKNKTKDKSRTSQKVSSKSDNLSANTAIENAPAIVSDNDQIQLKESIKENTDNFGNLKKIKSPLSVKGCLLNLLILVVLTFAIVFVWCYFTVDNFNILTIFLDIMDKFGITEFFKKLFSTIAGWFK